MILTPAYRRFHTELVGFHQFAARPRDPRLYIDDFIAAAVNNFSKTLLGGDEKFSLLDADHARLLSLIEMLDPVANRVTIMKLETLTALPVEGTAALSVEGTAYERKAMKMLREVIYGETFGYDGAHVFGEDMMREHLSGLETGHDTEMTVRAFEAVTASLRAFDAYLAENLLIQEEVIDCDAILDARCRLLRVVEGI